MALARPTFDLCGQILGGQLGCLLPGGHEGPHDIGGRRRAVVPVIKPVETPPPRPAAPPSPKKSKPVPPATKPRPGPVAAGELAWAKIKGFPWWPARVEAVRSSTADVLFFGTQQQGRPKVSDVVLFASCDTKTLAARDARFAKQLAAGKGLSEAIAEAQAALLPKAEARCKCATVQECECAHVRKAQPKRPKAETGGGGGGGGGGRRGGEGGGATAAAAEAAALVAASEAAAADAATGRLRARHPGGEGGTGGLAAPRNKAERANPSPSPNPNPNPNQVGWRRQRTRQSVRRERRCSRRSRRRGWPRREMRPPRRCQSSAPRAGWCAAILEPEPAPQPEPEPQP